MKFLDIEPTICAKRDYKGLYLKAEKNRSIVFLELLKNMKNMIYMI